MGTTDRGADATTTGSAAWFRWVAVITAVLALVQALLAGQGLFVDAARIEVHGWVGNATVLASVALLAAAFVAWQRSRVGRSAVVLSGVLLVLVVAQLGLGYSGRESAAAASWHIPNGVLIFGLSAAILVLAFTDREPATVGQGAGVTGGSA